LQPGTTAPLPSPNYTPDWWHLQSVFYVVQPTQAAWRAVFLIASGVYMVCGGSYLLFSTGVRQAWDSPDNGVTESSDKNQCDVAKEGMMLQATHK